MKRRPESIEEQKRRCAYWGAKHFTEFGLVPPPFVAHAPTKECTNNPDKIFIMRNGYYILMDRDEVDLQGLP